MVALFMVGLCVSAAMVIDLGLLRVDRQEQKSAEDAASIAGANGLVPNLKSPTFHPFAGVCQAKNYLKATSSAFSAFAVGSEVWSDGNGATTSDGCDAGKAALQCANDTPSTWARFTARSGDGTAQVWIQSGYKVRTTNPATDGNLAAATGGDFSDEDLAAYSGDTGSATLGGCDQVAVIISQVRGTTLGAPAVSSMGTRTRSVARVTIEPPKSPFALLMLERYDCQVLTNTSNGIIDVTGYKSNPGLIHVDSDGTGDRCVKPIIVGAKENGVFAHEAPDTGEPGQISTVATSNQSDGIANVHAGPYPPGTAPISSGLATREVLDSIYLEPIRTAKNNAQLYLTADTAAALPPPPSPATWAVKNTCNADITGSEEYVFIDCARAQGALVSLPNAKVVVFKGSLVAGDVRLPRATRVYVRGQSSPAKGIDVGTTGFQMNNETAGAACPTQWDASKTRAQLFLLHSDLKATGGTFTACNTTVILLGGDLNGCLPTSSPIYIDDGKVCPAGSTGTGLLTLGGNTNIDWTAPDIVDDELPGNHPSNVAGHAQLEDLALWTETYGVHTLGGGGTMHLLGVFAAPSAHPIKLNGGPTQNVKNSQYVARSVETTGNGTLQMTPLPSLPVAPPSVIFDLVR